MNRKALPAATAQADYEGAASAPQGDLFGSAAGGMAAPPGAPTLPPGWRYQPAFIDEAIEADLLARIAELPLQEARYKAYTAKRRIASFGTEYDFDSNRLLPGAALPPWLEHLRRRCAAWQGLPAEAFSSALVAEYRPGTQLGWHRDVPDFELVIGVSLGSACRMRLRRYPPVQPTRSDTLTVELGPRSAYLLSGTARWGWQHSIAPTPGLRHSITFRTRADRRGGPAAQG